jgi:hypothetical protein
MITYMTAIVFGLCSFCSALLTPLLFGLRLCGYQYYIIRNDTEKTRAVIKKLQSTTYNSITLFQSGNFYPSGYFMSWKCAGFYNHNNYSEGVSVEIHVLTTPTHFQTIFETEKTAISFAKITDAADDTTKNETQTLTIYSRVGSYTHLFYSRLRIDIQGLEPRGKQTEIVDKIGEHFAEKCRGVFFIHGVSGAGKSTIGLLLAERLNGTYCHTFNPSDPGDTLPLLLRETEPTNERPTIILIEEANMMIRAIHNDTLTRHKNITTVIHNKSTYNTFMDDLILFRNVIIIMTSNEDKDTIDTLDPCYLRKGRVDAWFSMMTSLDL